MCGPTCRLAPARALHTGSLLEFGRVVSDCCLPWRLNSITNRALERLAPPGQPSQGGRPVGYLFRRIVHLLAS